MQPGMPLALPPLSAVEFSADSMTRRAVAAIEEILQEDAPREAGKEVFPAIWVQGATCGPIGKS
jgi:DNA-binding LacI/PurR family transcriptional regulator